MDGGILGASYETLAIVAAVKVPLVAIMVWLCARIAGRAGYNPWRALWMLVPIFNITAVWAFAYGRWPVESVRPSRAAAEPDRSIEVPSEESSSVVSRETGWVLSGFDGNGDRVRLEISDGRLAAAGRDGIEVGRSRSCALTIDDESVSRVHATLLIENGELCIVDLDSTNGTFVDDQEVEPGRAPVAMRRGAQVMLGDVRLSVNRG